MSEHQDAVDELEAARVLEGVRWAFSSAATQALEDYFPESGHDHAWLGQTRFTFFRDRLDRVFACERYAVEPDDGNADLDMLYAGLSSQDAQRMPRLKPDLVERLDLERSPGWVCKQWRLLLAACPYGKIGKVSWQQRSRTKQWVACQRSPEPQEPTLFDAFAEEEVAGLEKALFTPDSVLTTLVVAHSLDPFSEERELFLGRPRMNAGGGQAWHWRHNLLDAPATDSVGQGKSSSLPTVSDQPPEAPDAPVRLRNTDEQRGGRTGEQP